MRVVSLTRPDFTNTVTRSSPGWKPIRYGIIARRSSGRRSLSRVGASACRAARLRRRRLAFLAVDVLPVDFLPVDLLPAGLLAADFFEAVMTGACVPGIKSCALLANLWIVRCQAIFLWRTRRAQYARALNAAGAPRAPHVVRRLPSWDGKHATNALRRHFRAIPRRQTLTTLREVEQDVLSESQSLLTAAATGARSAGTGIPGSALRQSCATVVGNGRAQRFRKHRHGTDAQRAVLRPLGARPG